MSWLGIKYTLRIYLVCKDTKVIHLPLRAVLCDLSDMSCAHERKAFTNRKQNYHVCNAHV